MKPISVEGFPVSTNEFPVPSKKFPVPPKKIPCSVGLREFACNALKLLREFERNRPESPFLPEIFQNSLLISLFSGNLGVEADPYRHGPDRSV
jgi:hypothetical protein